MNRLLEWRNRPNTSLIAIGLDLDVFRPADCDFLSRRLMLNLDGFFNLIVFHNL